MEYEMKKRKFHTIASILMAAVFSFCRYDKGEGLVIFLLSMALVLYLYLTIKSILGSIKKDSYFLLGMIFLLGLSDFLTDNRDIHATNNLGIFLLTSVTVIHNFYYDNNWSLTKYLGMIARSFIRIIPLFVLPFREIIELINFYKSEKNVTDTDSSKKTTGFYVLIGILTSIPIVILIVSLLASADAVFGKMVDSIFVERREYDFAIENVIEIIFLFFIGLILSYSGIRLMEQKAIPDIDRKAVNFEEVIAITVLSIISVVYLIFSVIQILYLFIGNFELPKGYTYAQYAREGFFQLLFVCLINLLIVLFVLKHFTRGGITKFLLTLISACTYIMIASSTLRMWMYVSKYNLTRQRVKVFWGLATLALIFILVVINIYKEYFKLSRWAMLVFCLCYLVLSFCKMDAFIAKYNLSKISKDEIELLAAYEEDYYYYIDELKIDPQFNFNFNENHYKDHIELKEDDFYSYQKYILEKKYKNGNYELTDVFNDYNNFKKVVKCIEKYRYEYSLSADAVPEIENVAHIFVLQYMNYNANKNNSIDELDFRHFNLSQIMAKKYTEN